MKKLLTKPLQAFILYSFFVLLASIPVYYFIVDHIWLDELNEHNAIVAGSIKKNLGTIAGGDSGLTANTIALWNQLQPGAIVRKADSIQPDSIYNINKSLLKNNEDEERLQGLITYFSMNGSPYSLTVETNVEETSETVTAIALVTIFFFLLLLTGFIILSNTVSRKLWQPFYNTLAKVKSFNLNQNQKIAFEKSGILEFEELNASLDTLIESNIATYNQQKEFAENASHELQTPLAIIQSKLDILLQNKSLGEEQSRIIEDANKALGRVSRINKNLLLLAKIENRQFSDKTLIDVSVLLADNIELLSDFFTYNNIHLQQKIMPGIMIDANKELVEILLTNLLLNAAKHTLAQGSIVIYLLPGKFEILNSGKKALNNDQLFKRFAAAYSRSTGSGLGLAIASQICNRYGWAPRYEFKNNMHSFSVHF